MFKNKTAWFSESVNKDVRRFWVKEAGMISDWRTSDYLFSTDAACPDTQRIHCSEEYLRDRATVFHSNYVNTCRVRQSTKSVPLAHYLLPPPPVQKEVKAVIGRFIWEHEVLVGCMLENETSEKVSAFHPDGGGTEEPMSQGNVMLSPPRDPSICCEMQLYPVNNMISGFVHIEQLKKFTGELHDFLPSHSESYITRAYREACNQNKEQE